MHLTFKKFLKFWRARTHLRRARTSSIAPNSSLELSMTYWPDGGDQPAQYASTTFYYFYLILKQFVISNASIMKSIFPAAFSHLIVVRSLYSRCALSGLRVGAQCYFPMASVIIMEVLPTPVIMSRLPLFISFLTNFCFSYFCYFFRVNFNTFWHFAYMNS